MAMREAWLLLLSSSMSALACAAGPSERVSSPAVAPHAPPPASASSRVSGEQLAAPPPVPGPTGADVPSDRGANKPPLCAGKQPGPNGLCSELPLGAASDAEGAGKGEVAGQEPVAVGVRLARGTGTAADEQLKLGDRAFVDDELSTAKQHYQKARKLAPKDPAPRVGLVRVSLLQSGIATDYSAAPNNPQLRRWLLEVEQALKLDPEYAPAMIERGRLLLIMGQANKALSSLTDGVTRQPMDPEAQSALGVALLATGDAERALKRFEQAQKLEPNNAERLTNLGTAYMMRGRVADALRAYKQAVVLAPDDARAHGDLGTAYLAQHRMLQALPYLKRAVALAPERATFLSNLGYAHQQSGNVQEAIKTYRAALKKDPRLGSAWINLATALAEQGSFKEAKQALERALAIDPTDPRAKANMQELEELMQRKAPK